MQKIKQLNLKVVSKIYVVFCDDYIERIEGGFETIPEIVKIFMSESEAKYYVNEFSYLGNRIYYSEYEVETIVN